MKFYPLQQAYKQTSNKKAFNLIELTITLALIIITTTLAFSSLTQHKGQHIAAEANALRSALWHLQNIARAQNKQKTLVFNEAENSYHYNGETHKLCRKVKFGTLQNVLGPPSSPKKQLKKSITFKNHEIIVTPQGILQSGTVYLIDDAQQLIYAITVPIAGVSFIRIYRYHNKQWHVYT